MVDSGWLARWASHPETGRFSWVAALQVPILTAFFYPNEHQLLTLMSYWDQGEAMNGVDARTIDMSELVDAF